MCAAVAIRRQKRATLRRVQQTVEGDALDAAIGAWLADRDQPEAGRRAIAVDGKTVRGTCDKAGGCACWQR
jgi:hypothetical protein